VGFGLILGHVGECVQVFGWFSDWHVNAVRDGEVEFVYSTNAEERRWEEL
jgi:hypothetical protein